MNISLKQLEVFVTIVECGNFTEAGRKLYLAQSTVSSHITALEETLRVSLFRRESKRTIELTADGKRVYQYAKDVVGKCLLLEEAVALEERRELVIGASTVPSKSLLPEKMMEFQRSHPECCCVVRGGDSEQIQQMVLDGDIQIGFVGSTDNRQQLCYEHIARDRLVLITDSIQVAHLPDGPHDQAGQTVIVDGIRCRFPDGTIAGSSLTLDRAVRNFRARTGLPLCEVVNMASLYPARSVGLDGAKGSLEAGKDADLAILDAEFNVQKTILGGRTIYEK